mmetsp:Transcript_3441/g.8516  ORF Transcript_3441/g.8516 Transcript_3441/m.8516 type:complete len:183 (+) Transcript_3441:374-922(+)
MPPASPRKLDESAADGVGGDASRKPLNATEKRDLAEIFHLVDRSGTGVLDWVELRRCLRGLGFPVSKKETRRLVRDKCGLDGFVKPAHFYEIVDELGSSKRDAEREMLHGFQLFTASDSHFITEADLRRAAVAARISADIPRMLAVADADGDGHVSRADFVGVMSKTALFCHQTKTPTGADV